MKRFIVGISALALVSPVAAGAADLGGNCCADLEERISELEATAAKKGNRKITLTVYGVIDKALMYVSGDGIDNNWVVSENSNVESFVGFRGEAQFSPGWKAGYVLEIGVGSYDDALFNGTGYGPLLGPGDTNGIYTRRSYGYIDNANLGRVTVGLASQATDGIVEISTANTAPAARMLSLRPITGPQIGDALDIFDGSRTNLVRYDSPTMMGAVISASWASGSFGTDDVWDIAGRWAGEGGGFKLAAGIGYRAGIAVPSIGNLGSSGPFDPTIVSGSASIKHDATGLFLTGAAGQIDLGIGPSLTAYGLQGGVETKLVDLGPTTLYGEWADTTDHGVLPLSYWGLGVVQHLDLAASDVYASLRRYDLNGDNATLFMAGLKVGF